LEDTRLCVFVGTVLGGGTGEAVTVVVVVVVVVVIVVVVVTVVFTWGESGEQDRDRARRQAEDGVVTTEIYLSWKPEDKVSKTYWKTHPTLWDKVVNKTETVPVDKRKTESLRLKFISAGSLKTKCQRLAGRLIRHCGPVCGRWNVIRWNCKNHVATKQTS
jgi:hypothetical protein